MNICVVSGAPQLTINVVPVFKLRGSFQVLTKLVLSDVHLSDDDLMNLNDLTSLHTLFLGNTHIGDVA